MLVRRISPNKWKNATVDIGGKTDVGADAITVCLRTHGNTLSVWKVENTSEKEVNNAILALITGINQEKLSKIDFVVLDEEEIEANGLVLVPSRKDGDTAVDDLVDRHYNIIDITYSKLGVVKDIILRNVSPENQRTLTQLKTILSDALEDQRINIERLKNKYIEKEFATFEPFVDRVEIQKTESSYSRKDNS